MLEKTYIAEKEIDGERYALLPLPCDKVVEHGNAIIAGILAPALSNITNIESVDKFAVQAMGSVLMNLSHPTVKAFIADLWETGVVNDKPLGKGMWKNHFLGEPGKMVRFLTWAMEAQLSDFFSSLLGVLNEAAGNLKTKAEAKKAELAKSQVQG
jgi:hypothetical protein